MCTCIDAADEALQNDWRVRTVFPFTRGVQTELRGPVPLIDVLGGRGRKPAILAMFCPFCGERLLPEEDA